RSPGGGGPAGGCTRGGGGVRLEGAGARERAERVVGAARAARPRAARAAALRIAAAAGKPVGAFRHTPENTYGFGWHPSGAGFVPISRDVFVSGGPYGTVTWNGGDRRARAHVFLMPVNFVSYYC